LGIDNHELGYRQKLELPISNYFLDSYGSKKLTEQEKDELLFAEAELEEQILNLTPKEL
jgi:hypothetical protein